jgi:hypothetical protein
VKAEAFHQMLEQWRWHAAVLVDTASKGDEIDSNCSVST